MSNNVDSIIESKNNLLLNSQVVFFRHYTFADRKDKRTLLLLHGAGVAGDLTWHSVIQHLHYWSDIIVPDLRGMGKTVFPNHQEYPFSCFDVVEDVFELLKFLNINEFDLGGYSFGGLIAMLLKAATIKTHVHININKQFLFESALLFGVNKKTLVDIRMRYAEVVNLILEKNEIEKGIKLFIELLTPKHLMSERSESIIIKRLLHRPIGFAYAVDCVNQAVQRVDRDELVALQENVSSFVGGNSYPEVHEIHDHLAVTHLIWKNHVISGADHALLFQKPRQIARLMNSDMQEYLNL